MSERVIRFAVLGDLHLNRTTERRGELLVDYSEELTASAVERVNREGVDLVLQVGDIADGNFRTPAETMLDALDARRLLDKLAPPSMTVMGNHESIYLDDLDTAKRVLKMPDTAVTELDGVRFVAVNSSVPGESKGAFSPAVAAFLENELASHADRGVPTVLLLHHSWNLDEGGRYSVENGVEWRARLGRSKGVQLVLHGHVHRNMATHQDGVLTVATTALVCKPLCYRLVTLREGSGRWRATSELRPATDDPQIHRVADERMATMNLDKRWKERPEDGDFDLPCRSDID
ncbi:MAG: metallophosphoesterase [Candidatus Poribacteria bacterium]|nr:metallophosphoesterase [Candidatus Poribacteria bacterium]